MYLYCMHAHTHTHTHAHDSLRQNKLSKMEVYLNRVEVNKNIIKLFEKKEAGSHALPSRNGI